MAFGKVAIRSESGVYEEYELTKSSTTVGRQPGNDVVLNTSAVSRYHARFDVADGTVYLVDLGTVNGTFVNDEQVAPEGRVPLGDGDVVQMGDMTLTFLTPESRARLDISLTPSLETIEQEGVPFRISIDKPNQMVAPGARMQIILLVENVSDESMLLRIQAGGLDPRWTKVNRPEMLLDPGEQTEAMVMILPPRSTDTKPGRYALNIRLYNPENPAHALESTREVDIVGYSGIAIASREDGNGRVSLAIMNQGNRTLNLSFGGYDESRSLTYQFNPDTVTIEPGKTRQVQAQVKARRRPPRDHVTYAIFTQSRDSASFRAPVVHKYTYEASGLFGIPWLSVPIAAGAGIAALVLIIALLLLTGIIPSGNNEVTDDTADAIVVEVNNTPEPTGEAGPTVTPSGAQITAFSPEQDIVYFGTTDTANLQWIFDGNVTEITLVIDGERLNIDTEDRHYPLSVSDLSLGENPILIVIDHLVDSPNGQAPSIARAETSVTMSLYACTLTVQPNTETGEGLINPVPQTSASGTAGGLQQGDSVAVIGRTEDSVWYQVARPNVDNVSPLGWMQADYLDCGGFDPARLVVEQ